jgi:F0F1-type ATP synthase membrane subunit b/b'
MSTQQPGAAPQPATLTSLPRIEDLPISESGYDADRVREAFDAFRRHALQLQAQLRVLQAAGGTTRVEPTAHAVRMDALHLIRTAAEFADSLERDAQNAAAVQLARAEEEIRRGQHELQAREAEIERYRQESDRQRAEVLNAAKAESREILANAERQSSQELREAEARAARLLEQARHQATELTNAARAEVEQTLEWARSQASLIITRAQEGAEQLLSAAGLGAESMRTVVDAIVDSAERTGEHAPPGIGEPPSSTPAPAPPAPQAPAAPPVSPPAAQPASEERPPPPPAAPEPPAES